MSISSDSKLLYVFNTSFTGKILKVRDKELGNQLVFVGSCNGFWTPNLGVGIFKKNRVLFFWTVGFKSKQCQIMP